MLGLRESSRPEMKITDREEVERQAKIKRIKEINRQSRPQFRGHSVCERIARFSGFGVRH